MGRYLTELPALESERLVKKNKLQPFFYDFHKCLQSIAVIFCESAFERTVYVQHPVNAFT